MIHFYKTKTKDGMKTIIVLPEADKKPLRQTGKNKK